MRDGQLIFKVERGQIVEVLQNPGLDQFYERLFRNAYRTASRSSATVDAGIRLVVFGVFWMEARCNVVLRRALYLEVHEPSLGPALWQVLKRAALLDKTDLLRAFAPARLEARYRQLRSQLQSLIELRNSLAHFKDSDVRIGGPLISPLQAVRILRTSDDSQLIRELRRPAVLKHARTVSGLSQWLTQLEKAHSKRRGVIVTEKRLPRAKT